MSEHELFFDYDFNYDCTIFRVEVPDALAAEGLKEPEADAPPEEWDMYGEARYMRSLEILSAEALKRREEILVRLLAYKEAQREG